MKSLNKRDVAIDWKKFASIDVNRLREQIVNDKSLVNEFGTYIAFCSTDGEFDTQAMDQNFVKLFKISQIIIEYLLNEFNRLKSSENEMKGQNNLIQENKKLRKLLEIHQKAMAYSGIANGDRVQCPHCPKAFCDSTFLQTHIARRHPNESLNSEGMFSLTRKIEKYQSVLIGDNKNIDQMRAEIQALSEKLGKTELDLLLEKEARIKLEERIEYDVEVRVQEIQEKLREEIEEFKFTQTETLFERNSSPQNINKNSGLNEQIAEPTEVNKIQEIIAIQAKEMIKLGNNVQKLVSHLTDSLPLNTREKPKKEPLSSASTNVKKTAPIPEPQSHTKSVAEAKNQFETKDTIKESKKVDEIPNKNAKSDSKKTSESVSDSKKSPEMKSFRDETEISLKEKLASLGIDLEAKGITEEEFINAMKTVKAERKLLIEQYRHDYDFVSVEKYIQKIVDEKVRENSDKKAEDLNPIKPSEPKVKERKTLTVSPKAKDEESKAQTSKPYETQSIEAIVHSTPVTESSDTSDRSVTKPIDIETKQELDQSSSQVPETQVVRPKSALASSSLKSGTNNEQNDDENGVKVKQQKRIRFSEHRIEHQISPDESSEDTSDDYSSMEFNNHTLSAFNRNEITLMAPIPAQRNNKNISSEASGSQIRDQMTDHFTENLRYEVDEDLMDEILHSRPSSMSSDLTKSDTNRDSDRTAAKGSNQTKVQELAEMIEQQLSKRSASDKKPPVGSVNIMSTDKQKLSSKSLLDELNSDSEDEYH